MYSPKQGKTLKFKCVYLHLVRGFLFLESHKWRRTYRPFAEASWINPALLFKYARQKVKTRHQLKGKQIKKRICIFLYNVCEAFFEKDQCSNWLSNTKSQPKVFLTVVRQALSGGFSAASYRVDRMLMRVTISYSPSTRNNASCCCACRLLQVTRSFSLVGFDIRTSLP